MRIFQIGDIVLGSNAWLNSMLGCGLQPGVITNVGDHSSNIHLFIINEDIVLMNEYIDKVTMDNEEKELKVGDLVEFKPELRKILAVRGVGTIISETIIRTDDFDGKWKDDVINAFLVYFSEDNYEYTVPKTCLQIFSPDKND